ncbi:MAG TPA: hypothetical protein VEW03_02750, partial [Longimicrobiaceae bacterium]|nr:hypothetical protein [Longimicrobiaceae bacterium]
MTTTMRIRLRTPTLAALLLAAVTTTTTAQQQTYPTSFSPAVANAPAVRDALGWIDRNFPAQIAEW